jgi:uncharacterized protein (TIGR03083 family)
VSEIPKAPTIVALTAVWSSVGDLLRSLDTSEWEAATVLEGWDVAANVAHIIGTEQMLLGAPSPEVAVDRGAARHVRNDIGAFNEAWVQELSTRTPAELLTMFTDVTVRRLAALEEMSHAEWDTETFTPAGRDTYGRFMRIRVFDCWFHEQDIREAVGRPGHDDGPAVEVTLDEVTTALGFVVGKRAALPSGESVTFELTGPSARTIHVAVAERATVVDHLDEPAAVTITLPVVPFTRLCGGRTTFETVRNLIDVEGDLQLGEQVLANLAYTV